MEHLNKQATINRYWYPSLIGRNKKAQELLDLVTDSFMNFTPDWEVFAVISYGSDPFANDIKNVFYAQYEIRLNDGKYWRHPFAFEPIPKVPTSHDTVHFNEHLLYTNESIDIEHIIDSMKKFKKQHGDTLLKIDSRYGLLLLAETCGLKEIFSSKEALISHLYYPRTNLQTKMNAFHFLARKWADFNWEEIDNIEYAKEEDLEYPMSVFERPRKSTRFKDKGDEKL